MHEAGFLYDIILEEKIYMYIYISNTWPDQLSSLHSVSLEHIAQKWGGEIVGGQSPSDSALLKIMR